MPKREDEYWAAEKSDLRYCFKHKRYYRADFGCQLCVIEKLQPIQSIDAKSRLMKCPKCGKITLFWNEKDGTFECLNLKCKRLFTEKELRDLVLNAASSDISKGRYEEIQSVMTERELANNKVIRFKSTARTVLRFGGKFFEVILMCLRGLGRALRTAWRKRRVMRTFWRILPKALLLLFILAIAIIITSSVCQFITGDLKMTPVIMLSIAGLVVVIWGLTSMSRYRVSFTRFFMVTLISIIFVIVSSTYLGIRSLTDVKDNIMGALTTEAEEFRSTVDLTVQRTELKVISLAEALKESTEETVIKESKPVTETGTTESERGSEAVSTTFVHVQGGILVGADGSPIKLQNNAIAVNPSWNQLKDFLLKDETDRRRYDINTFVCADFAEMLHNNAEKAGIRTSYVSVQLGPCLYYPYGGGHALNAVQTTDRGLVYIDCTGANVGINADKTVDVKEGKEYIPHSIFPEPGWSSVWENMGAVKKIEVVQW